MTGRASPPAPIAGAPSDRVAPSIDRSAADGVGFLQSVIPEQRERAARAARGATITRIWGDGFRADLAWTSVAGEHLLSGDSGRRRSREDRLDGGGEEAS